MVSPTNPAYYSDVLFRCKLRHLEAELEQLTEAPELNTRRCGRQPEFQQEEEDLRE